MKEIMGRSTGLCKGKGGSMHIADIDKGMLGANAIVGGGPPLVNGAALAAKTLGTKNVALSFNGDGSANQGTTMEAMNMAVVLQLPHVFVYENNGYAEGTAANYGLGCDSLTDRNSGFGMPAECVDGNDFFATYEAIKVATQRARDGGGPTSIEAKCVRFDGHFIGDPQLYGGEDEVKNASKNEDCLKRFGDRVIKERWLKAATMSAIDKGIVAEIEKAVADGLAAPRPDPSADLLSDVYSSY